MLSKCWVETLKLIALLYLNLDQVSVTDHNGIDSVISQINLPGVSFGELSLMYGKPRTATVTCVKAGWLWCLERKAFRGILVDRMTHDNTVKILRKVSEGMSSLGPQNQLPNACFPKMTLKAVRSNR